MESRLGKQYLRDTNHLARSTVCPSVDYCLQLSQRNLNHEFSPELNTIRETALLLDG